MSSSLCFNSLKVNSAFKPLVSNVNLQAPTSRSNADPERPWEWETGLAERHPLRSITTSSGGHVETEMRRPPFVTVPISITEDRLVRRCKLDPNLKESGFKGST